MGANVSRAVLSSVVDTAINVTNSVNDTATSDVDQSVAVDFKNVKGDVNISGNVVRLRSRLVTDAASKVLQTAQAQQAVMTGAIAKVRNELEGLNLAQANVSSSDLSVLHNTTATVAASVVSRCQVTVRQAVSVGAAGVGGNVDFSNNRIDVDSDALQRCYRDSASAALDSFSSKTDLALDQTTSTKGLTTAGIIALVLGGLLLVASPVLLPMLGLAGAGRRTITGLLLLAAGLLTSWMAGSAFAKKKPAAEDEKKPAAAPASAAADEESRTVWLPEVAMREYVKSTDGRAGPGCVAVSSHAQPADGSLLLATVHADGPVGLATEWLSSPSQQCLVGMARLFAKSRLMAALLNEDLLPPMVVEQAVDGEGKPVRGRAVVRPRGFCFEADRSAEFVFASDESQPPPAFGVSWWQPRGAPSAVDRRTTLVLQVVPSGETLAGSVWRWTVSGAATTGSWVREGGAVPLWPLSGNCLIRARANATKYGSGPLVRLVVSESLVAALRPAPPAAPSFFERLSLADYVGLGLSTVGVVQLLRGESSEESRPAATVEEIFEDGGGAGRTKKGPGRRRLSGVRRWMRERRDASRRAANALRARLVPRRRVVRGESPAPLLLAEEEAEE